LKNKNENTLLKNENKNENTLLKNKNENTLLKNENFENIFVPDFNSIYNLLLSKYKDTNIKILLIGSISQKKLDFINNYFNNSIIYIYNEDKTYYKNLSDNIIQNENYPYNINEINSLANTHINFDIILTSGQISVENFGFIATHYINLLSDKGIIIFENIQSINNANIIINAIPLNIKNKIDIIDLRRVNSKYDSICIILDKTK
jgi:hypothetical protein